MTKAEFDQVCGRAEVFREQGKTNQALIVLNALISDASAHSDRVAEALGHRILCYKHLYQNTEDINHLHNMCIDARKGLGLQIPRTSKAKFYLRLGDVYMLQGSFVAAERAYRIAYEVCKKGDYSKAEFLGHWAEAKALNGKCAEAIGLLKHALAHLKVFPPPRPFHRLIVVSGVEARLVRAAFKCKSYGLAMKYLIHSYMLAWWLKIYYGNPVRLKQFHGTLFRR